MPPKRNVVVDLDRGALDLELARVLRNFFANVGGTAKARAQQIIGEEVKDRSGALKSHVDFELHVDGDKVYLEFFDDAGPHAVYQHEGTGIYGPKKQPIRSKTPGKLLTWVDPDTGKRIWAKEVRGTPAKKYLERAVNYALDQEIRRHNK